MTDPQPLLSHTAEGDLKHHRSSSLDDTIESCIGDLGWKHIFQATYVSLAWFFDAQQTFISIFTDAEPNWTCLDQCTTTNLCRLPSAATWTWDSPPNASIISEWSLQCSGSIIKGLPASSFFLGCLVGGFALATLADSSLGRKKLLVLSSLLMSFTGVLTALSTGVWMYTALRFLSGFGRGTIGTCALVLSTELVGKKWREKIGIIGFICFTLGFLSLPLIAFCNRDSSWRLIYLWTCLPSLLYSLSLVVLVSESPRWLYINGRKQECVETLRSMSANRPTNLNLLKSLSESSSGDNEKERENIFSAAKILVGRGWSCRRLLSMMAVGFGIGMIYYGMPLGLGNLSVNLYLSVTLNAASEFPASLFTFLFIGKLKRKEAVVGLCVMSGICSVWCCVVSWQGMEIVLELLSFFCACTAFDIVLIYTLELFPTCVRNSAVSMVRQALVFGGALSPLLVAAGRNNGFLSYGVFGVAISVCAVFVVWLPETRGRSMCDTIQEEERRLAVDGDGGGGAIVSI